MIVVFGNYVLLSPLIVLGDAAETARNIVAHQTQVRIAVICFLTYSLGVFVLLTALYVVLRPVDPGSRVGRSAVPPGVRFVMAICTAQSAGRAAALENGNLLQVFQPDPVQALARLHLGANFDAYYVGLPFFGLAATVAPSCGSGRATFRKDWRSSA